MRRKVDLHLHTYASDGEWSGEQLIKELDKNNIKIFSVTDHDETACVPIVERLVRDRKDFAYIKGTESTFTYMGKEHHLLLYGIDEKDQQLQALLKANRDVRMAYDLNMIDWLSSKYPQISVEDFEAFDYNPYQGGWRTYGYLEERGVIAGLKDYFFKSKDFKYKKVFQNPETFLPQLIDMGIEPVLAHPPAYTDGDIYDMVHLDRLREMGIKGIECYSQYLEVESNSQYYVDYCKKHNLMITGGSDCHGGFAGRRIGHPDVDESMICMPGFKLGIG